VGRDRRNACEGRLRGRRVVVGEVFRLWSNIKKCLRTGVFLCRVRRKHRGRECVTNQIIKTIKNYQAAIDEQARSRRGKEKSVKRGRHRSSVWERSLSKKPGRNKTEMFPLTSLIKKKKGLRKGEGEEKGLGWGKRARKLLKSTLSAPKGWQVNGEKRVQGGEEDGFQREKKR